MVVNVISQKLQSNISQKFSNRLILSTLSLFRKTKFVSSKTRIIILLKVLYTQTVTQQFTFSILFETNMHVVLLTLQYI